MLTSKTVENHRKRHLKIVIESVFLVVIGADLNLTLLLPIIISAEEK